MKRIGLLSDTHGYLDPALKEHFHSCDEIWHAGDFGGVEVIDELSNWGKPLRLVWGNIDDHVVRSVSEKDLLFQCDAASVFMTHIAGYPKRYNGRVRSLVKQHKPNIVVCGHSHILKVIYDRDLDHLHINPGAAGKQGFHNIRTAVRFTVHGTGVTDFQIIELGKRGALQ